MDLNSAEYPVRRVQWTGVAALSAMVLFGLHVSRVELGLLAAALRLGMGIESLPLFLIILGGVFFIIAPLRNGVSRWFEGRADQFALELANKPEAQSSVMVKLCHQNVGYTAPHPTIEFLFCDHPAELKRVQRALMFGRESDAIGA